jgi:hypothetical protein
MSIYPWRESLDFQLHAWTSFDDAVTEPRQLKTAVSDRLDEAQIDDSFRTAKFAWADCELASE